MIEKQYEIYVNGMIIASNITLKYALILIRGVFEEDILDESTIVSDVTIRPMPEMQGA